MRFALRFMASASVVASVSPALAQTTSTTPPAVNNTVASQTAVPAPAASDASQADPDAEREALQPIGAHFGSFTLYPKLETSLTYSDNIYALQTKTSDVIARLSPTLDLRGDFGTTTAALRASLDRYQYFRQTTENRTDFSIGGNAQAEVSRDVLVYAAGGFSQAHEDRGDPNSQFTDRSPTKYRLTEAGAGFSSDLTRLSYGLDGSYRKYDFVNNRQISGLFINNDDRDREQFRVAGRVGLELSPGYRVLARGAYEKVDYRLPLDDGGFNRDSNGFRATLGVEFELTRLLTGEVFGGYLRRRYVDVRFVRTDDPVFGARLSWKPTALTTVRVDIDRSVQETIVPNFSGYVSTGGTVSVEHELLRTVILSASARYEHDDYRGTRLLPATRRDENYGASAGVRYALNRNVYAGANYDYSKRDSTFTGPGLSYNRNRVTATLGLQF